MPASDFNNRVLRLLRGLLLGTFLLFHAGEVFAAEPVTIDPPLSPVEMAEEQARTLDTTELDGFLAELNREMGQYLPPITRENLFKLLRGEENPWQLQRLAGGLLRYLFQEVIDSLDLLARLLILAVLAAVLYNLQSSFENAGVARIAHVTVLTALVGMALTSFYLALQAAGGAVDQLMGFMQAILPLMITMLAASGSFISAGIFHPFVLAAAHLSSLVVSNWVFPLLFAAAVVETVNGFFEQVRISGVARLLRQVGMAALGFGFCIFLGALSVFGAAGSVADGVALRSAKFMAKSFIPVVGGMFADAAELVASSSILLRNGIGLLGLMAVFATVALPLLKLVSLVLIYRLAAAAVQPIAGDGVVSCLDALANSILLVCLAVGVVALMFFLSITVLVGAGNVAVMFR